MQLVLRVLADLWHGASYPSLDASRTTYVSEAALCCLHPMLRARSELFHVRKVHAVVPAPRAHLNCIASLGRCASLAWIPVILSAVLNKIICFPLLRGPWARARRNPRTTRRAACQRVSRQHRRHSVLARL